ncbi:QCR1, core subunit of the ubiquinol-cytochrome c reductase complex [Phycomyces blakesleeanus]|uniref:mitochondrial processing peptidase n=1 Tax=Phycomyces blakesleeanus TaxID=4837 RepID=A0ABR3AX37_PHYBL
MVQIAGSEAGPPSFFVGRKTTSTNSQKRPFFPLYRLISSFSPLFTMASRLLSNTFPVKASLTKQFVRPLATAAKQAVATRTTVLPNGLTVATEENSQAGAATVGVWIDAGSRSENVNGTASFLENAAVKSQASAFEKLGGILRSNTTRDQTFFAAKTLGANAAASVEIISNIIQTPVSSSAVAASRADVLKQLAEIDSNHEQVVFDHLYATAFQGSSLSRPTAGVPESVESVTAEELAAYQKTNYAADRMVLVGSGDISHEALVKLAEQHFGAINPGQAVESKKPYFTGSEIRLRDDLMPQARVAIAVEGAAALSEDYFNLLVMQAVIGSWDRTLGAAAHLSSRLSTIVNKNHLANSFASFTKGHKDTGLFGIYFESENREQIDDFVHFLQNEWVRLSTSVTAGEIERAKQQVKAGLLLNLDTTCSIAGDIGSQILTNGKRLTGDEIKSTINKITAADVRRTANKYLWDQEVAVVGLGPIEGLTDYNRVRGNMAYNRF